MKTGILSITYESVLVPHFSLKCNSKFPVGMSKFPVQTRNFQLDKVEISSSNSKFPVQTMVNEPIRWNNYFDFVKLEISSSKWKFRLPNWKFRLRQTGNFDIPTGNFEFKLEISTSASWKFRHPNWKFRVQTRNFDFGKLEISTSQLEISSSNSKFRVAFQVRMWHQYAFVITWCKFGKIKYISQYLPRIFFKTDTRLNIWSPTLYVYVTSTTHISYVFHIMCVNLILVSHAIMHRVNFHGRSVCIWIMCTWLSWPISINHLTIGAYGKLTSSSLEYQFSIMMLHMRFVVIQAKFAVPSNKGETIRLPGGGAGFF